MKICSQCRKTYEDNNLNFCLDDGTALVVSDQSAPTVMLPSAGETATQQAAAPTQWQQQMPMQQAQPPRKSSKAWVWVLLILGVVILLCGGGLVGGFFYVQHKASSITSNWPDFPTPSTSESPVFSSTPSTSSTPNKTAKTEGSVTYENYKRLKIGMDRSEAETILGGKGNELSSSSGGGMKFAVIQWQGDNFDSIILTFQNGKLFYKTQVGLGDGDE